jgi:Flp pilus assembly pilin Flp
MAGILVTKGKTMFAYAFALLDRVLADKKGVTALEYGVIGAAAVVVLLATFRAFYTSLDGVFTGIAAAM